MTAAADTGPHRLEVVKLGGSLLTAEDLPDRLERFLRPMRDRTVLVIVGGGQLIDAVRRLDQIQSMPPSTLHWRCVDLLDVTFEFAAGRLAFLSPVENPETANLDGGGHHLVRVGSFYRPRVAGPLPEDWSTTTDAIAVQLAIEVLADRVTLLKSCEVQQSDAPEFLAGLSATGVIDAATPAVAERFGGPVRVTRLP